MSLRQDLIDVIYSNLTAEEVLDAMLDLLTERADEWLLAIEGSMVSDLAVLADGLAVLRNPGSQE